jgi:inosine-uridine nucleoside N-ribohydrolase
MFRLTVLFLAIAAIASAKRAVILSTDVGNEVDDQWAIGYLLMGGELDVKGIVSANAPTLPAPSAHYTYRVLVDEVENRLALRSHPPLLEGSSETLTDIKTAQPSDAARFIVEISHSFSKDNRLVLLTIGAATDVASAILMDPTIVDRVEVVAMGFKDRSPSGGQEFNVQNDPHAWQVILNSTVPVTIGSGDVCREFLAMPFDRAAQLLSRGSFAHWLWDDYQRWYFKNVKPLRVNDFSKPWIIWDIITIAYLEGLTKQDSIPRPSLTDDLALKKSAHPAGEINWITSIDSQRLWTEFSRRLESFQATHALPPLQ